MIIEIDYAWRTDETIPCHVGLGVLEQILMLAEA
jgi:hypothetical protein